MAFCLFEIAIVVHNFFYVEKIMNNLPGNKTNRIAIVVRLIKFNQFKFIIIKNPYSNRIEKKITN